MLARATMKRHLTRISARTSIARTISTTKIVRNKSPLDGSDINFAHPTGEFARTDDTINVRYPGHGFLRETEPAHDGGRHYSRTLGSFSLEGKVCVVTGAARGLGYTMTQAFIESGAEVAIIDLNKETAQESAHELGEWFRKQDDDAATRHTVTSGWGCDVLVTSAGFTENFAAQDYPIERVRKLNAVNIDGTFLCAQNVARHLIATGRKGNMIFIGSMSGNIVNIPQPQAPYNASKAAVKHLAASMAVEWAKFGIRVNTIAPGYMLTALTKKILDENQELKRTWEGLTPMGGMLVDFVVH
ncbi:Putative uncharacterized protein [Taphrina deformans PYCC 5710]|uniref:Uncharacterized protein n=1 Tax=Taphrina deformans (strain PYCC 5710 / ATCC 11124 / CBS 356.35 / IMI 108563 / JCM 9778 / NBRC 8474) TaxID=1097556 RepID=R4X8B9_TAPDE|nr:Putative uncharacterized protein [Taphrina deformans PYCC 5710]|eukprot:CCG81798.2 Putative uncharacterized protein [Taphrina deformans PYCC 5710]